MSPSGGQTAEGDREAEEREELGLKQTVAFGDWDYFLESFSVEAGVAVGKILMSEKNRFGSEPQFVLMEGFD